MGVLLALLLAQAVPGPQGPVFSAPSRSAVKWAAFEFAPSDGTGMGGAPCLPPNWNLTTEEFAGWGMYGTVTAATFVASNAALSPTGTMTADRVSFAATTSGQGSWTYQTPGITGPLTGSIHVKGVSSGGTLDLCMDAPTVCAPCAFTASSWTRCSVSATTTGSSSTLYIGNMSQAGYNGGVARPAQDVYLWGVQTNVGLTATTYFPATATGGGFIPTGTRGEPLSLTRSSSAFCTKGNTTTGIQNGDLVLMPYNVARVMPGDSPGLGLLVESSRTNTAVRSQEFENAAWTPFTVGSTVPVVTANQGVAPDGTMTADRVQVAATTGGNRSLLFQATVATDIVSVYVKGYGGTSGVIDVATDIGGSGGCGCAYNGTTWTRCRSTTAAAGSFIIGNDGTSTCGPGARAAADVLLWGAQRETGAYATSYIPTTSATVTRTVDLYPTLPVSWPSSAGTSCVGMTYAGYTPLRTMAWSAALENSLDYLGGYIQGGQFRGEATQGATPVRVAFSALPASNTTVAIEQTGTTITTYMDGTLAATTTAGVATTWTPNRVSVGNGGHYSMYATDAVIKRVLADPSPTRCRGTPDAPLFEFAPSNGAGIGTEACPLPNWLARSNELQQSASWTTQASPTTMTITANASGDMERLQIQATSGGAYSLLYQDVAAVLRGSVTLSLDVMGYAGSSGTFKAGVFNGALFTYGNCAFGPTVSRCSVTVDVGQSPTLTRVYMGNDSANIIGNPAQAAVDVLVGSVQLNTGSTAAPFVATTTAAAGSMPTGSKGEVLTFVRASTATCTKGNTKTGIQPGDLVTSAPGQLRVMPGGDGSGGLGVLIENWTVNNLLRSAELDNAAWSKNAVGSTVPVVTANYALSPDGTMSAERVQFGACPAVSNYSAIYMLGLSSGARASSVYCKGTSATQTISVCNYPTACQAVTCPADSWTRVTAYANPVTGLILGCEHEGAYAGSSDTGAADVLLWGAQSELTTGGYATSYIPTTSVAVQRNGDQLIYDLGPTAPRGDVSVALTVIADGYPLGPAGVLVLNQDNFGGTSGAASLWLFNASLQGFIKCYYGGTATSLGVSPVGTNRAYCASTAGGVMTGQYGTTVLTASPTIPAYTNPLRYMTIGCSPWPYCFDSVVKQVSVSPDPWRAR